MLILAKQPFFMPEPTPVLQSDYSLLRHVKIANRVAWFFAILAVLLQLITILRFGTNTTTPLGMAIAASYLFVPLLNRLGYMHVSRVLLCSFMPIAAFVLTVYLKSTGKHSDILYYDSRILLLTSALIPCLVFHTRERVKLAAMLSVGFLCLVLFDPVHEAFGQGYYQKGFTNPSYSYINTVCLAAYLAITAGGLVLKIINERVDERNTRLIEEKEMFNNSLQQTNAELQVANALILEQQNKLSESNRLLEEAVQDKTQKLSETNEELIRHNHELQQFSYTVSHNLRAPVARLLGLTNLVATEANQAPESVKKLTELIRESSLEFDRIIRDLNKIIDVRNTFYRIKEKVMFDQELALVKKTIDENLFNNVQLTTDFAQEPVVYTVQPILNSILYNMVSNAIKYKSPQRPLQLSLKTYKENNFIVLEIKDNGIGMNLESYGGEVFGLYKRFHAHIEGRGIGLYLVKSQIESLGGKIEVKSRLNVGTAFYIYFEITTDIDGQVILNNNCCNLFYNARISTMGIIWKRQPEVHEYQSVFNKSLEMMVLYHTPHWISDMRLQGKIAEENQRWLFAEVLPAAIRLGLQTVLCICDTHQLTEDYRINLKKISNKLGLDTIYFETQKAAEEWIDAHQHKKPVVNS